MANRHLQTAVLLAGLLLHCCLGAQAATLSVSPTIGPVGTVFTVSVTMTAQDTFWGDGNIWVENDSVGAVTPTSATFSNMQVGQTITRNFTGTSNGLVHISVYGYKGSYILLGNLYFTVGTAPPDAQFTASPTTGTAPLAVTFSNTSTGATSYSWNFGDSGTSTAANPSHTYTSAGSYTVTLTATNSGGSDTATATINVSTPPPPDASFSASDTSGQAPLTVNFTDTSTGSPSAWEWDFGDGSAHVTTQNASHTYTTAGTRTVTLSVGNFYGTDTATTTITVTAPAAPPPGGVNFAAAAQKAVSPLYTIAASILGICILIAVLVSGPREVIKLMWDAMGIKQWREEQMIKEEARIQREERRKRREAKLLSQAKERKEKNDIEAAVRLHERTPQNYLKGHVPK